MRGVGWNFSFLTTPSGIWHLSNLSDHFLSGSKGAFSSCFYHQSFLFILSSLHNDTKKGIDRNALEPDIIDYSILQRKYRFRKQTCIMGGIRLLEFAYNATSLERPPFSTISIFDTHMGDRLVVLRVHSVLTICREDFSDP